MMPSATRPAGLDDIPVLVTLMSEFYEEAGFSLPRESAWRTFATILGDTNLGRIWIIEHAGEPVGYLVLTVSFSMEYGGLRGFIDDFFVKPSVRNKGLGRAALRHARQACIDAGLKALLVETGPSDYPAHRLYVREGFAENGRVFLTQSLLAPVHEG